MSSGSRLHIRSENFATGSGATYGCKIDSEFFA